MRLKRGFVHIYTGHGKGKTTAALGLALRASGAGWQVLFVQFLKPALSSEIRLLKRLPGVTVRCFGKKGFILKKPGPRDRAAVARGWQAVRNAVRSGQYDLVIADEILVAQSLGLVAEQEILDLLAIRHPRVELVLTGRGATPRLVRAADVVTEMRERKHYYHKGVIARQGIEF